MCIQFRNLWPSHYSILSHTNHDQSSRFLLLFSNSYAKSKNFHSHTTKKAIECSRFLLQPISNYFLRNLNAFDLFIDRMSTSCFQLDLLKVFRSFPDPLTRTPAFPFGQTFIWARELWSARARAPLRDWEWRSGIF